MYEKILIMFLKYEVVLKIRVVVKFLISCDHIYIKLYSSFLNNYLICILKIKRSFELRVRMVNRMRRIRLIY